MPDQFIIACLITVVAWKMRRDMFMFMSILSVCYGLCTCDAWWAFPPICGLVGGNLRKWLLFHNVSQKMIKYNRNGVLVYIGDNRVRHDCFTYLLNAWWPNNLIMMHIDDSDYFVNVVGTLQRYACIELVVDTCGGNAYDCMVIASILLELKKEGHRLNTYVPRRALSAGTMHVLTGHELFVGKYAYLTQVDVQYSDVFETNDDYSCPARDLVAYGQYCCDGKYELTMNNYLLARDADRAEKDTCEMLIKTFDGRGMKLEERMKLMNMFMKKNTNHGTPIFMDQLVKVGGLKVHRIDEDMEKICEEVITINL